MITYFNIKTKTTLVANLSGSVVCRDDRFMEPGTHRYKFIPANLNMFIVTILWRDQRESLKQIAASIKRSLKGSHEYLGSSPSYSNLKSATMLQNFSFSLDDEMLCIRYQPGGLPRGSLIHGKYIIVNINIWKRNDRMSKDMLS